MSEESRKLRDEGQALIERAKKICDHANHRHDYDSDGPGYHCSDCDTYGWGNCPVDWPCSRREVVAG